MEGEGEATAPNRFLFEGFLSKSVQKIIIFYYLDTSEVTTSDDIMMYRITHRTCMETTLECSNLVLLLLIKNKSITLNHPLSISLGTSFTIFYSQLS